MPSVIETSLILLFLLQVKHMFADFFLQTPRMLGGRDQYLHLGRTEHAGLHALLSLIVLIVMGMPVAFTFLLCIVELIVHYHIDWIKGRYSEQTGDTPADARYWRAFGVDQLAHQLTYLAMIWAVFAIAV